MVNKANLKKLIDHMQKVYDSDQYEVIKIEFNRDILQIGEYNGWDLCEGSSVSSFTIKILDKKQDEKLRSMGVCVE
jgi:hypothetical protein